MTTLVNWEIFVKKLGMITLALMMACGGQSAFAEWMMIGYENAYSEDSNVYINLDSVVKVRHNAEDLLMFATKFEHANTSEMFAKYGTKSHNGQWYASCQNQSYFIKDIVFYNKDKKAVNSSHEDRIPPLSAFEYAFPETVASGLIDVACSYQYPKEFKKRIYKAGIPLRIPKICKKDDEECFKDVLSGKYDYIQ